MIRATIVERGCGERTPGGLYAECGLSDDGEPLEHFLVCSPLPLPEGADLVNKPQLWTDPQTGITHIMIWIGAEHYPYVADYIEETRKFGASRKLHGAFDVSALTPGKSRMVLVHPHARITNWAELSVPHKCPKHRAEHVALRAALRLPEPVPAGMVDAEPEPTTLPAVQMLEEPEGGPCLGKCYETLPDEPQVEHKGRRGKRVGIQVIDFEDGSGPTYWREFASTTYQYHPVPGEHARAKTEPGVFAVLPISGFALVRRDDGTVNEGARKNLDATGWEYYEAEK